MKRIILYVLLSAIFLYLGITKESDMIYFEMLNLPFDILGSFLKFLSLENSFLNAIAVLIYIIVSLSPIVLYILLTYRKGNRKKNLLLFPISFLLFYILYYAVNPHLMVDHVAPEILSNLTTVDFETITAIYLSGIGSLFYALLGIYLILIFLTETNLNIKKTAITLMDITVVLIIAGLSMSLVPSIIESINQASTSYDNSIILIEIVKNLVLYGLIGIIIYYTFLTIKSFDIESPELSININKLYQFTYLYILIAFGFIIFENGIIFLLRGQTDNTNFVMDIPLLTLIFAGMLLVISKYIKESNLIKEDNELII